MNRPSNALVMTRKIAVSLVLSILAAGFLLGTITTVANERWDGISVCVDHKTRNVSASSGGRCPGGSTLKAMGLKGQDGENGSKILSGQTTPSPEVGNLGDLFLNTSSAELFGPKSLEGWGTSLSLRGPAGPAGIGGTGPQGPAGPAGPQGPAGSGASSTTSYYIEGALVSISATATNTPPTVVLAADELESGFYSYIVMVRYLPTPTGHFGSSGPTPGISCMLASFQNGDYSPYSSPGVLGNSAQYTFAGWVEIAASPRDGFELRCDSFAVANPSFSAGDPTDQENVGDDDGEVSVKVTAIFTPVRSVEVRP